jgi:hypothetical protein
MTEDQLRQLSQQDQRAWELYDAAAAPPDVRHWKTWDELGWRTKTMYRVQATKQMLDRLAPWRH